MPARPPSRARIKEVPRGLTAEQRTLILNAK